MVDKPVINLDGLGLEQRKTMVYYSSSAAILFRSNLSLEYRSCESLIVGSARLPTEHTFYQCAEFEDLLVLCFGPKQIVLVEKSGLIDSSEFRYGKITTRLFPSSVQGQILCGTRLAESYQFILYDALADSRVFQTLSVSANNLTDFKVYDNRFYAIFDNAYIMCFDSETGERLWTRFESGHVARGVIPYRDAIIYCCQGLVKIVHPDGTIQTVRIPFSTVDGVLGVDEKRQLLYLLAADTKYVRAYNLRQETIAWEIKGTVAIKDWLLASGRTKKESDTVPVLILRTADHLGILDLKNGRMLYYLKVPRIRDIRQTGDHILLHDWNRFTHILPGTK